MIGQGDFISAPRIQLTINIMSKAINLMSDETIDDETVEGILEELQGDINRIESRLNELTVEGKKKTGFTLMAGKELTILRGEVVEVVYQIGLVSDFFTRNWSRVLRVRIGLWKKFRELIKICTTMLSKFMKQLKLDSIEVTLGVPPSITVTLIP